MRRKRIRLAIIGSKGIDRPTSIKLVKAILSDVQSRYDLKEVITIKECPIGQTVRAFLDGDVPLKTYSEKKNREHEDAAILTAASIVWATKNYILVHDGSYSWAQHLKEILDRWPKSRRYKLLDFER